MSIMNFFTADFLSPGRRRREPAKRVATLIVAALICATSQPCFAADDPDAPKGATVTVLKAAKFCFSAIAEISGILIPREEIAVRPDRPGLKVAEVLVDAGETVTAGQTLARLSLPEGGATPVQAPVAGLVSNSSAVTGAIASGKGEALFSIIARNEFDLVGQVSTRDLSKLAVDQVAKIKIVGAGEVAGKVRRVSTTDVAVMTRQRYEIEFQGSRDGRAGFSTAVRIASDRRFTWRST